MMDRSIINIDDDRFVTKTEDRIFCVYGFDHDKGSLAAYLYFVDTFKPLLWNEDSPVGHFYTHIRFQVNCKTTFLIISQRMGYSPRRMGRAQRNPSKPTHIGEIMRWVSAIASTHPRRSTWKSSVASECDDPRGAVGPGVLSESAR